MKKSKFGPIQINNVETNLRITEERICNRIARGLQREKNRLFNYYTKK